MLKRVIDNVWQRDPSGCSSRTAVAQESVSHQLGAEWVATAEAIEQVPHGPPPTLTRKDVIQEDASITFQAAQQAAKATLPHAPARLAVVQHLGVRALSHCTFKVFLSAHMCSV